MKGKVLITGGAGFIGSHLTDHLLESGYEVTVYDNLTPQVHKDSPKDKNGWPDYLNNECKKITGDILDTEKFRKAIKKQDYLVHLAASVGVGQSMTNIFDYTKNNELGGASVIQALLDGQHNIKKIAAASSISIYGDGAYKKPSTGQLVYPGLRSKKQLDEKQWEITDTDGEILEPVRTAESKPLFPSSIYAVNKMVHEYDFLIMGRALNIPVAAMRMFNVYGTRQSLSNPYTGVAAIFISRLKNNKSPVIFEDGKQSRNFVHISDIVSGYKAFLDSDFNDWEVFNLGSEEIITIANLAKKISIQMRKNISPLTTQKYRLGDIRHCYPDLTKIKKTFNWKPKVTLEQGLPELIEWSEKQLAVDYTNKSLEELRVKGWLK